MPGRERTAIRRCRRRRRRRIDYRGDAPRQGSGDAVPLFLGIVLIILGALFLMHNLPIFSPFYYWARHYVRHFFWPSLLIVFGVFLIARGWKK